MVIFHSYVKLPEGEALRFSLLKKDHLHSGKRLYIAMENHRATNG